MITLFSNRTSHFVYKLLLSLSNAINLYGDQCCQRGAPATNDPQMKSCQPWNIVSLKELTRQITFAGQSLLLASGSQKRAEFSIKSS